MKTRLIRNITVTDRSSLEDLILVMAMNVEESLSEAGAIAGKDYTYRDLWTMAMPFALDVFKDKESRITYRTSSDA